MKKAQMRAGGSTLILLLGVVLLAMGLLACPASEEEPTNGEEPTYGDDSANGEDPTNGEEPVGGEDPTSGECCVYTGPVSFDCASIENLGPGADLDGRCNAANQGNSCSWLYGEEECCKIANNDGHGEKVDCEEPPGESGRCCRYTGPTNFDCASIENLGPGADLDGRCNAVNQGNSCSWFFAEGDCCEIAVDDGFPGTVTCP